MSGGVRIDRTDHIYTDRGAISILLVAIKGAMGTFGLFLLVQAFSRGEAEQVLWGGLALIAGGAFFGGYDLIKLLDRSPQLTLGPEGFVDHRVSVPVVIPWDHFGSLGYRGGGEPTGWRPEIFLTDGWRQRAISRRRQGNCCSWCRNSRRRVRWSGRRVSD